MHDRLANRLVINRSMYNTVSQCSVREMKLDMEYEPETAVRSRLTTSYVLCKSHRRKTSSRIGIYCWVAVEQREILLPRGCKF